MTVDIPSEKLIQILDQKTIAIMVARDKMRESWLDSQKGFWGFILGEPKKDLSWKEHFYENKLRVIDSMRNVANMHGSVRMELEEYQWISDTTSA